MHNLKDNLVMQVTFSINCQSTTDLLELSFRYYNDCAMEICTY